jgi:hypothetical protein
MGGFSRGKSDPSECSTITKDETANDDEPDQCPFSILAKGPRSQHETIENQRQECGKNHSDESLSNQRAHRALLALLFDSLKRDS